MHALWQHPYSCSCAWGGAQGVPVRVEVGPRDVEQGTCVVSRRDQPGKAGKQFGIPLEPEPFVSHVTGLLQEIQDNLYAEVSLDACSLAECICLSVEHAWLHGQRRAQFCQ